MASVSASIFVVFLAQPRDVSVSTPEQISYITEGQVFIVHQILKWLFKSKKKREGEKPSWFEGLRNILNWKTLFLAQAW